MVIKKGDFIEVEYTGKLKDDNGVFDTTSKAVAEENNIYNPQAAYGPVTVVIGEKHLIAGLDEEMIGKEVGKDYSITLPCEKAFGKRDAKLLQLVPTNRFKKENINPMSGMQVNIDGALGVIRSVSGGRTIVDFNHPLASRDVIYEVAIKRIVEDTSEKVKNFVSLKLSLKPESINVTFADGKALVTLKAKLPGQIEQGLSDNVKRLISEVKSVEFKEKKDKKGSEETKKEK